jgi:hypothetical protein
LVGQTEHNNTIGTLETHDARTGQWKVKMSGGQVLTLKPANLMLVSTSGSSLAQTHATQSDAAVAPVLVSTPGSTAALGSMADHASTPGSTADHADCLSSKFAMDIKALVTFGIELFDSTLQEQLGPADGDILRAMYAERPRVFLLVEHNMEFVMSLAGEIIVMHQGAVLERGSPDAVKASPRVIEAYLG